MFIGRISLKYVFLLIMSGLLTGLPFTKLVPIPGVCKKQNMGNKGKEFPQSVGRGLLDSAIQDCYRFSGKVFGAGPATASSLTTCHMHMQIIHTPSFVKNTALSVTIGTYCTLVADPVHQHSDQSPRALGHTGHGTLSQSWWVQAFCQHQCIPYSCRQQGWPCLWSEWEVPRCCSSISLGIILSVSRNARAGRNRTDGIKSNGSQNEK